MEVDLLKVGVLPDFPLGSEYFPQRFNRPFDKNNLTKNMTVFFTSLVTFSTKLLISPVHGPLANWLSSSVFPCLFVRLLSRYGNITPNLHFFQFIQA